MAWNRSTILPNCKIISPEQYKQATRKRQSFHGNVMQLLEEQTDSNISLKERIISR